MTKFVQFAADGKTIVAIYGCSQLPDHVADKPGYAEIADTDPRWTAWQAAQQPSQTEIAATAVQSWLDTTARSQPYGYNDIVTACTYAGSSVDLWNRQGVAFKAWRDSVWQALFALQAKVAAGTATAPATVAALIAALPQPNIPTS